MILTFHLASARDVSFIIVPPISIFTARTKGVATITPSIAVSSNRECGAWWNFYGRYIVVVRLGLKARRQSNNRARGTRCTIDRMENKYMRGNVYSLLDDSFVCPRAQSLIALDSRARLSTRIVKIAEYRNKFCIWAYEAETSSKVIDTVRAPRCEICASKQGARTE